LVWILFLSTGFSCLSFWDSTLVRPSSCTTI
jgi:hypothetical protein